MEMAIVLNRERMKEVIYVRHTTFVLGRSGLPSETGGKSLATLSDPAASPAFPSA